MAPLEIHGMVKEHALLDDKIMFFTVIRVDWNLTDL